MGKSIGEREKEAKREYEDAKSKFCETVGIPYKNAGESGTECAEKRRRIREMHDGLAAQKRSLEEDASRVCAEIDRLEEPPVDNQYTLNVDGYDFTLDELEEARRQEALRRHAEFEYREKLNNEPSPFFALILLAIEFYIVKKVFFAPPYDIGYMAIGVLVFIVCMLFHSWDLLGPAS